MPRSMLLGATVALGLLIASSVHAQSLVLTTRTLPPLGFFPRSTNSLLVSGRPQTTTPPRLSAAIFDPQVSTGSSYTPGGAFDPAAGPGAPSLGSPFDPAGGTGGGFATFDPASGIGATPASFDPQSSGTSGITFVPEPAPVIIVTGTLNLDPIVGNGSGLFTAGGGIGLSPTAPLSPGFTVSPRTTGLNVLQTSSLDTTRIGGTAGTTGFTPTGSLGSARFTTTANPEPATALLLGLATLGAALAATRRRRPHEA